MTGGVDSAEGSAKSTLRREMRSRLSGMGPGEHAVASADIAQRLMCSAAWAGARSVAAFVGVGGEVDTLSIIECAQREGKRVLLPRCSSSEALEFAVYPIGDALKIGRFGIPEPIADRPGESLSDVDLVLVPGLAFDRFGGRLGKGAGYYDRAFALLLNRAVRPALLGLSFALQIVQRVPMTMFDVHLDAVVTESAWLKSVKRPVLEKNEEPEVR